MIHLPFIAGLIAGAAAVSALRSERGRALVNDTGARLRTAYDDAESGVRTATRSGFDMLRGATSRFAAPAKDASGDAAQADTSEQVGKAARPPRRRAAATAKSAAGKAGAAKPGASKSGAGKSRRVSPKAAAAKAEAGGDQSEA